MQRMLNTKPMGPDTPPSITVCPEQPLFFLPAIPPLNLRGPPGRAYIKQNYASLHSLNERPFRGFLVSTKERGNIFLYLQTDSRFQVKNEMFK